MIEETRILDRQEGVDKRLRDLIVGNVLADLVSEFEDEIACSVKDPGIGQCGKSVLGESHSFRIINNIDEYEKYGYTSNEK